MTKQLLLATLALACKLDSYSSMWQRRVLVLTLLFLTACAQDKAPKRANFQGAPAPSEPFRRPQEKTKQSIDTQLSNQGFYDLATAGLPLTLSNAADSVFMIKVLALEDEQSATILDVSAGKGAEFKKKIMALDPKIHTAIDKQIMTLQVDDCEKRSLEDQKTCLLTLDIRSSTGFLSGNGSTLWTNAHVIEAQLKAVEKYQKISIMDQLKSRKSLRIFIYNRHGHLVLNSYETKVLPLKYPDRPTAAAAYQKTFYAEDSDYVALSLGKSLGRPLPAAAQGTSPGEEVYLLGYPACTGCSTENYQVTDPLDFRDRSPSPNSNGEELKVSIGHWIEPQVAIEKLNVSASAASLFNFNSLVFNNVDSQHGNSGGPYLNVRGEVVAIHSGGKSFRENKKVHRVSRGVKFPIVN